MRRLGYNPGRDQLGAKKSWARLSTLAFAYPNCERLATLVRGETGDRRNVPQSEKMENVPSVPSFFVPVSSSPVSSSPVSSSPVSSPYQGRGDEIKGKVD